MTVQVQTRPPFILTDSEKQSPLWGRLSQYFEVEAQAMRIKLCGDLGETETAKMRGAVSVYVRLAKLSNDQPVIE